MEVDDIISYHEVVTAEIRGAHCLPAACGRLACWFESLAVAQFIRRGGRPLQRRLAEINLNPSWSAKHASETAVIFQFFGIGE